MSLKAFHIVFISVSAMLAFGFGIWVLIPSSGVSAPVNFLGALLSVLIGASLVVYGIRFLRRFKHIRFL